MRKQLPWIFGLLWVGIAVLFFVFSMRAGGAAIHGHVNAGRYYVGMHGQYPEVSRGVFVLSALLSAAFGLTLPLFAGAATWQASRKPEFNPLIWIGPLLALAFGLTAFYFSLRCLISAFFGS